MAREPLDPNEGPTLWISDEGHNSDTFKLLSGTDPDNPVDVIVVSRDEIERAINFIRNN